MKARFLFLAAVVLGLASCQTEPEGIDVNVGGGEQLVTINVTVPETETRAGGSDSALGVFDNGVLNGDATMRYILQVYYNGTPSDERLVKYSDGKSVAFDVRLVPDRDYQFVVWADVVDGEADVDKHYNTSNLKNVELNRTWVAMDESRDAFTATEFIEDFNSAQSINITLKRPFAKLRVVTTDVEALNNLDIVPTKATVEYTTKHYNAFNAFEGKAIGDSKNRDINHEKYVIASYGEDTDAGADMTLFTDYFFVSNEGDVVKFEFDVYDQKGDLIKSNTFNTDIYVKRNHLTTIKGNILTDGKNVKVDINDAFDQPNIDENIWDGKSVKAPAQDADGNYIIYEGSELAWIADQVNGVTRAAANTFKGQTIKLMKDVNLGGNEWTPIGMSGYTNIFNGTFDGQGHTIANLVVNNNKCAGLFGGTTCGTFKNLTIDGAELITNHYAGAIVAWTESGATIVSIENCHVKNAKITVTPELVNGKYDNGDKAGAIVGHAHATDINRCTADNIVITAFRDVAGIAGYASKHSITNCSVKNAVITADQIHEYDGDKDGNAGVIVGRIGDPVTLEGNTTGENVTVIRKVDSTKEFEEALKDRRNEDVIYVGEGEVVLPASLVVSGIDKLTIEGLDTAAVVQFSSVAGGGDGGLNCYADGTELIFKNIKVVSPNTGSAYTGGFGRAKSVLFNNCYYEGQYRSMSYVKFDKCTIDPKTSYIYTDYSNADFVECTFNCSEGKGIQVYNDGNTTDTTINVTDCTFTAAKQGQTWDNKPVTAIDINSNGEKFTVNINNSTTTGFPEGLYSGESLFNIKGGAEFVTIMLDGNKWLANGAIEKDGKLCAYNVKGLQYLLDKAVEGENTIYCIADIEGDVTVTQKADVKIAIKGNNHKYAGVILVDGKSATYTTAGVTIKNLNFEAETISADACIRLGDGTNATRYACNVTVEGCTFAVPGAVAVKSYTGGDKNLTINNCTGTGLHSLAQLKNVDGVTIEGVSVTAGRGASFGASSNIVVKNSTFEADSYGLRVDGSKEGVLSIEGGKIEAYIPVSVRKMSDDGYNVEVILDGTEVVKGGLYDVAICSNEYEEGVDAVAPKGTFKVLSTGTTYSVFPTGESTLKTVAKVGSVEYTTIDEAIANWGNNATLTLLDNVTLSDVITIKSTEHHILDLGTYTMTAAEGKNAFEITACGTGAAERFAITINADATNPGGIDAGNKAIVYYDYSKGTAADADDRPIIKINGGVFKGATATWGTAGIYFKGGTKARQAATLNISGGEFYCSINGQSKSKMIITGGLFHYSVGSQGDSTANRLISGGTFKTLGFMTADSNNSKFWFGTSMGNSNVGLYINDDNYLVVGGPVITDFGTEFEAKATNATKWSSYLQYSSAATYGLYYTNAEMAITKHGEANVVLP